MNEVKFDNSLLIRGLYSTEELVKFIENQKTKELVPSEIYNSSDSTINVTFRDSQQVSVNQNNPFVCKLRKRINAANEEHFKIKISEYCKETHFLEYSTEGKFERHKDLIWPTDVFDMASKPFRKLTSVVLLNSDFTGGKLAIWNKDDRYSFDFIPGDVIVFPSYVEHMVYPVLSGIRNSLVSWSYGEF